MTNRLLQVLQIEQNTEGLYHYKISGLNNYWLAPDLYEISEEGGEETICFPQLDEIQAAIGMHICGLERPLGPREIRFLRKELDCSQADLGNVLGYQDKQMVAAAEKRQDPKPLMPTADMLLRERYLHWLGFGKEPPIGDEYRDEAMRLSESLRQPHLVEERHWKVAA